MHQFRHRWQHTKPSREQLAGFSASEFKTLLKQRGYKIARDFFKNSAIANFRGRAYRFRYWGTPSTGDGDFVVDISCPLSEFDRWANSVYRTITVEEWLSGDQA